MLDPSKVPGNCEDCAPSTDLEPSEFIWPEMLSSYPGLISSGPLGGLFVSYENCRIVALIEDINLPDLIQAMEALKTGYSAPKGKK